MTRIRRDLCVCAAALTFGLALAGWYFRHALNSDGVAYLRLGSYWAEGRCGLAVSGCWGPLLSWLVAALVKTGLPLLAAGRVAMAVTALVFFWGCVTVYRAFDLPEVWVRRGAWAAALAGVYWSVHVITPDLLVSGLIALAASRVLQRHWLTNDRARLAAGALWGLAYLAKAVAFPLGIFFILLTSGRAILRGHAGFRAGWRTAGMTFLAFGVVAAPWMLCLSLKYGRPVFSTSARIVYAVAGPPDVERYHPATRTFHVPDPGRVTSWEDPSTMAYRTWSPFENKQYAMYEARLLLRNAAICLWLLTTLNLLWPVMAAEWWGGPMRKGRNVFGGTTHPPEGKPARPEERGGWTRPLGLAGLLVLLYLPFVVRLTEQRYFYAAFPFLFAAAALWLMKMAAGRPQQSNRILRAGGWLVMAGVVAPVLLAAAFVRDSTKIAGECAHDLAGRIEAAHLAGPIAGSGTLPGGRTGMYVAFLLNQPWYGDELQPTIETVKASGARLFVVNRESTLATTLARAPGVTDLDRKLFANAEEAEKFPLIVFQVDSP